MLFHQEKCASFALLLQKLFMSQTTSATTQCSNYYTYVGAYQLCLLYLNAADVNLMPFADIGQLWTELVELPEIIIRQLLSVLLGRTSLQRKGSKKRRDLTRRRFLLKITWSALWPGCPGHQESFYQPCLLQTIPSTSFGTPLSGKLSLCLFTKGLYLVSVVMPKPDILPRNVWSNSARPDLRVDFFLAFWGVLRITSSITLVTLLLL